MLEECALGVEISEDRRHASIAAAGPIDDGFLMVELVDYLDGPAGAVDAVLGLQTMRTVSAVVVDGRSHAATLIRPLTDAGVQVTQPSTSDVAVATGQFLDELAAGRLRPRRQPDADHRRSTRHIAAAVRDGGLGASRACGRRGATGRGHVGAVGLVSSRRPSAIDLVDLQAHRLS